MLFPRGKSRIFRRSRGTMIYGCCLSSIFLIFFLKYPYNTDVYLLSHPSLRQLDPDLHDVIRNKFLVPPESSFYNLSFPKAVWFSQHGIEPVLEILFHNKMNGIFFEAGAYDGEINSNTLYLERNLSWTGILVEPVPTNFENLRNKGRKSVLVPACLSRHTYTEKVNISQLEQVSTILAPNQDENNGLLPFYCNNNSLFLLLNPKQNKEHEQVAKDLKCWQGPAAALVHCFPLYSILAAANYTTVDFMSLDLEGNEIDVLATIPFEKVDIKVLLVEVDKLKDVDSLANFLATFKYEQVKTVGRYNLSDLLKHDMMFIKGS